MAERKWEKVDMTLTNEERRSFKSALVIFAIIEALVLVPLVLYKLFN